MPNATAAETIAAPLMAGQISATGINPPAIDDGALPTADAALSFENALVSIAGATLSFYNATLPIDGASSSFADVSLSNGNAPLPIDNVPLSIDNATPAIDDAPLSSGNAPLPATESAGNGAESPVFLAKPTFPHEFPKIAQPFMAGYRVNQR
jgi:hypothetical protein